MPEARTRTQAKRVVGLLLVIALLAWVGHGIFSEAQRHPWSWSRMDPSQLVLIVPLLIVAYLSRAVAWVFTLREMEPGAPMVAGMRVFLGSQLGRYIPGKAWQVVGAGWLGGRLGLSPAACIANTTVTMIIHHAIGGLIGLFVLWRFEAHRQAVIVLIAVAGLVMLLLPVSGVVPKLLAFGSRFTKTDLVEMGLPSARYMLVMAVTSAFMWALFGVALHYVARLVLPDAVAVPLPEAISTMAASAVIGFAVLVAPSGLGVREALVVTLLAPTLGTGGAGLVAIATRIVMTIVELVLSLWGVAPWMSAARRAVDGEPADV